MKYLLFIPFLALVILPTITFGQTIKRSSSSVNANASMQEFVLEKKRGFFTCSGGSSVPLFKQDCKLITVKRVSFGGNISYEALCKDSSGTQFSLACIAFSFEPDQSVSIPSSDFLQ